MPLTKLQFEPGLNRETTGYANQGGWWDSDKVRFRSGYAEKIGGWQNAAADKYFLGTCRAIHPWIALDGNEYIGWGTSQKYYILYAGTFYDVTPIRETTAAGALTFAAAKNTLNGGITATATTLTLTSTTGFPANGGLIKIDSEQIRYSLVSGSTLTGLQRGQNGTTAASHSTSANVFCATITVTDASHGAVQNDFVTISGAVSLGGAITAAVLNQEYQITSVLSGSTYTVDARAASTSISSITVSGGLSPSYVFPSASDTGTGGTSTVGEYQINTGLDTTVQGSGWGAGIWGGIGTGGTSSPPTTTGWGDPATVTVTTGDLRLWNHDNFGENLIFNANGGGIYYWQKNTAFPRAVTLASLTGASDTPTLGTQVMVSDNDRHVVVFGSNGTYPASTGIYTLGDIDPLNIRFSNVTSDSTNPSDFQETSTTGTAGSIRIGTGSYIVTAIETKQEIVVFTDVSLHSFKYVGAPNTFGIFMLSDNISIASSNAGISVDDTIFWMGNGEFYTYSGVVQTLPCDVKDYIFSRINQAQLSKVFCGANINYSEVWWFYPSDTVTDGVTNSENDSYVVYNYQQKIWYIGSMTRTAWTHKNSGIYPIAAAEDNSAYLHELGTDDGSTNPPSAITAYIESSGQDIGDGERFVSIWRIIPDITFRDSSGTPYVIISILASNFPDGPILQNSFDVEGVGSNLVRSAQYPPEQAYSVANGAERNAMYVRIRGRSFTFRIESNIVGAAWRLGLMRVDLKLDGKR
tara:strand:- start:4049 stop:6298 length:2250 start_codon:yes stop_codon:yes gene_type:complete